MANKDNTQTADHAVTIEVSAATRNDIKVLAKIEARKLGLPRIYNNQYVTRLVEREKAKAIKNGDWDSAA